MNSMLNLILLILLVKNCLCGDDGEQIFFPRDADAVTPPCVAYDGSPGVCRLLIQCATFFSEIAQLSRSPCAITENQQGVCCPPTKQPTEDPVLVATKMQDDNIAIMFPEVTLEDLNHAGENSLHNFEKREQFAVDLVNRHVIASPGSPVFWHSRLFETSDDIFKKGKHASIVLDASANLVQSFHLSKAQAEAGLSKLSVINTVIKGTCPNPERCPDPNYSYRTMDGSCNNLQYPDWGKTGVAFTRLLLPDYKDGILQPRSSGTTEPLPSARLISSMMSPSSNENYSNLTNLIWQWGQFLDHDITHTPISKGANKSDISCCRGGQRRPTEDLHPECWPIRIPQKDPFFSRFSQTCMEFVRSMAAIRPKCSFGAREQMNQITSFIDASNVYGSTEEEGRDLRLFRGGELKTKIHNGKELLPGNKENVGCLGRSEVEQCFLAGDSRVNEQPDLAVMHTVWVRQHNKIVRELSRLNPTWSDEALYQEGRRIVGAQMQHITYNEYLPIILGRDFMETYGLLPQRSGYFRGYRDDVNPSIANSFATAAFRFGHTLITDTIQSYGKFGNLKQEEEISKMQFFPFALYQPEALDSFIRGLSLQQSQKFDRFFSDQLTNKLFAQGREFGMDLVALNIQRGRDHGIAGYSKWRQVCDLPPVDSWQDLLREMDIKVVERLRRVYRSVHDIDLFVGGVSEQPTRGSLLGPTFLCIVGRQFIKLKIGDRFYYENGHPRGIILPGYSGEPLSSFTEEQLDEIRKTSLARILCDNSDEIEMMQPVAFVTAHLANKRAVCKSGILIPRMSLEPWTNTRV